MSLSGSRILDPVFRGSGAASPKGKQSDAIFEWSGFEFCELSCWILLVEQSAQISYMIIIFLLKLPQSAVVETVDTLALAPWAT